MPKLDRMILHAGRNVTIQPVAIDNRRDNLTREKNNTCCDNLTREKNISAPILIVAVAISTSGSRSCSQTAESSGEQVTVRLKVPVSVISRWPSHWPIARIDRIRLVTDWRKNTDLSHTDLSHTYHRSLMVVMRVESSDRSGYLD